MSTEADKKRLQKLSDEDYELRKEWVELKRTPEFVSSRKDQFGRIVLNAKGKKRDALLTKKMSAIDDERQKIYARMNWK